uniref:Growth-regulating factor n=1 Tax=Globodera pallida TaxID=36090 RepID=A0A183C9A3_GLOPA
MMDLSGSTSMDSSRNVPDKPGTSAGGGSDALSSTRQPSLISSLWSIQVQHEGSTSDFPMESPKGSLPEIAQASSCCHFQSPQGPAVAAGASCTSHQLISAGGAASDHLHHHQQPIGAFADDHPLLLMQQQQQQTVSSAAGAAGGGSGFHMPYGNNPLRPVKSLSDLSSLTAGQMCHAMASMCPYPCDGHNNNNQQQCAMNSSNRRLTETGIFFGGGVTKQQRDSQICDWLQSAMLAMRVGEGGTGGVASGSESPPEGAAAAFGQPRPAAQGGGGGEADQ